MASLADTTVGMEEMRTIIVTGASSGIGAYCARALKADGWRVFATARKPEDIAALEADGIEAFYLDYREPDIDRQRWSTTVLERTGGRSTRCSTTAPMRSPARSRTCRSRRCASSSRPISSAGTT